MILCDYQHDGWEVHMKGESRATSCLNHSKFYFKTMLSLKNFRGIFHINEGLFMKVYLLFSKAEQYAYSIVKYRDQHIQVWCMNINVISFDSCFMLMHQSLSVIDCTEVNITYPVLWFQCTQHSQMTDEECTLMITLLAMSFIEDFLEAWGRFFVCTLCISFGKIQSDLMLYCISWSMGVIFHPVWSQDFCFSLMSLLHCHVGNLLILLVTDLIASELSSLPYDCLSVTVSSGCEFSSLFRDVPPKVLTLRGPMAVD